MRLAVVGCGDAARTVVLATRFVRDARFTAFVDSDISRARRMSRLHPGSRVEQDYRALLEDDSIDGVYIALPHGLHHRVTLDFARCGMGVLLEKPLAESAASGRALLEALPSDARVGVNYQFRYDRKAWALVQASRAGALGQLQYITVDVPWFRGPEYFESSPWHGLLHSSGGGTLLTHGSHALDIALLCCGSAAREVCGRVYRRMHISVEVEDLASGVVETDLGIPIFITSSMVSRPGFRSRIAVYGSRGAAAYQGPSRPSLRGHAVRVTSAPVLTELHGYRLALRSFARWIERGAWFRCPAAEAMPVLEVVDAFYRSAADGTPAQVARY